MKSVGLVADAKRIAEKYVKTIEDNFKTTGRLWEKYNAKLEWRAYPLNIKLLKC